jgi:hypothetical protein
MGKAYLCHHRTGIASQKPGTGLKSSIDDLISSRNGTYRAPNPRGARARRLQF